MVTAIAATFVFTVVATQSAMKSAETPLSSQAANRYYCAFACDQLEECGGYIWNENAVRRCTLATPDGTEWIYGDAYRKLAFRGQKLIELDLGTRQKCSIRQAFSKCGAIGLNPVPLPRTVEEKAVMLMRSQEKVPLGVKREGTTAIYKDMLGELYDTSDQGFYPLDAPTRTDRDSLMQSGQKFTEILDYFDRFAVLFCLTED